MTQAGLTFARLFSRIDAATFEHLLLLIRLGIEENLPALAAASSWAEFETAAQGERVRILAAGGDLRGHA